MNYSILFAVMTAIFWGCYGPVLSEARAGLSSPFKPYLAIGVAYMVWGAIGGFGGMWMKGDNYSFSGAGTLWGLAAGSLGAFGALTLTMAMFSGGKPFVVMPIVFGGAVTISALVSVYMESGHVKVNPLLWVGIAGILVCTTLVAYYTPHAAPKKPAAAQEAKVPAAETATGPAAS